MRLFTKNFGQGVNKFETFKNDILTAEELLQIKGGDENGMVEK